MVSLLAASAGLSWPPKSSSSSSSWPRMQLGQKNPFQNAPGPFIYALPNLAGTCPFSHSDTDLFCSLSGAEEDSINDAPTNPDPHRHHRCCHNPVVTSRCCHRHHYDQPPSESAEPLAPTAPTEEGAPPDTESPQPLPPLPPSPPRTSTPLSPSDESHFGLGDIDISSSPLTEGGSEEPGQQEPHASELAGELSTSTPSTTQGSPIEPDFQEGSKEEGVVEEVVEEKEKKTRRSRKRGGQGARLRRREQANSTVAPRFLGLPGVLWPNYVCPQAPPLFPPPPPAMNCHNAWSVAGYHHHHHAFAVPPNSPAVPQFWMVPVVPTPGFVGALPVAC